MVRRQRAPFWLASAAFLLVAATLVIFFIWTYPANQATRNWTVVPADWQQLRWQWEVSHALNALIAFGGFCSLAISMLVEQK